MPATGRVLISAHRCGFKEGAGNDNTVAGVRYSAAAGADFVEFDVRRCRDGVFVCRHDPGVTLPTGQQVPVDQLSLDELRRHEPDVALLSELVAAVDQAGCGAHVDLKFATPTEQLDAGSSWEVAAAEVCVAGLNAERVIFTTNSQPGVVALRAWVDEQAHASLVGLTVGQSTSSLGWLEAIRSRQRELFPGRAVRDSGATLLVAHHALARVRLTRWAARHGIPLLVWTVDGRWLSARLLRDRRVWMFTTNRPARAVAARAALD